MMKNILIIILKLHRETTKTKTGIMPSGNATWQVREEMEIWG
jgi:hypothetical protein